MFFSVCLLATVGAYASFKFIVMVTYEDVSVTTKIDKLALDKGFSLGAQDGF